MDGSNNKETKTNNTKDNYINIANSNLTIYHLPERNLTLRLSINWLGSTKLNIFCASLITSILLV